MGRIKAEKTSNATYNCLVSKFNKLKEKRVGLKAKIETKKMRKENKKSQK